MYLRALQEKDAPLMLEWMHDPSVVGHLGTNFMEKTLADCQNFIAWAQTAENDLHLAVADDDDTYMGTVSLKHIANKTAEFAITFRASAMGKGYAKYGMAEILRHGVTQLGLDAIYWCVSPKNARAVRFYDKNGYARTEAVPSHLAERYNQELIWYLYKN